MKMEERERLVKEEAIERGLREGRIRGREEGRKEGREEGREEGRKEGRIEGREEGRKEGERIGEERLANLLMKLSKQNRQEDSIKALEDLEYRNKLYEEFGV